MHGAAFLTFPFPGDRSAWKCAATAWQRPGAISGGHPGRETWGRRRGVVPGDSRGVTGMWGALVGNGGDKGEFGGDGQVGDPKDPLPPHKSKITPCCSFSCCFQVGSGPCRGITSVTWFNVTESFPGLQGPPLGRHGREPRLTRVNFGCTFPCCLFGVLCFVLFLYLANK